MTCPGAQFADLSCLVFCGVHTAHSTHCRGVHHMQFKDAGPWVICHQRLLNFGQSFLPDFLDKYLFSSKPTQVTGQTVSQFALQMSKSHGSKTTLFSEAPSARPTQASRAEPEMCTPLLQTWIQNETIFKGVVPSDETPFTKGMVFRHSEKPWNLRKRSKLFREFQ